MTPPPPPPATWQNVLNSMIIHPVVMVLNALPRAVDDHCFQVLGEWRANFFVSLFIIIVRNLLIIAPPHIHSISYAGSPDPYDANAGTSTQSFITIMAIFYSLIPYLLQMYFGIHFLAWGNIVSLTRLGIMLFLSVVNDAILKNVLKQPLPIGSCLYFHSYGMPR